MWSRQTWREWWWGGIFRDKREWFLISKQLVAIATGVHAMTHHSFLQPQI